MRDYECQRYPELDRVRPHGAFGKSASKSDQNRMPSSNVTMREEDALAR